MWYRVRKSWDNEKSQIGAYQVLDNAINVVKTNPGYFVFDESGNLAYVPPADSVVRTMSYKAKLRKKIGSHKKGETVEVTRDRQKRWLMMDGTVVPNKSDIDLLTQIYDNTCKYPRTIAEEWVNTQGFSSKTEWLYWCNKYGQRVYIFKGKKGAWSLLKTFKCGTGNIEYGDGADQGVYFKAKIYDKQKQFVNSSGQILYWNMHYSSLHGNCIHKGGTGKPCTHGCISMGNNAVQWVYNNLPIDTKVIVF